MVNALNTTYQLNAKELDQSIVDSIKALFKDKEIEITVTELDETEYLLRSTANRERLLAAIERVESGGELIVPDQEQFQ